MKHSGVCLIVVGFFVITCKAWPVTNSPTGSNWDMSVTNMDFRTVVARTLMLNHFDVHGRDSCDWVMTYAEKQGIPMSNVVNEAKTIAEEGFAMVESGSITNEELKASILRYCQKALILVCRPRDPSALPYLESKSVSENYAVRETASRGIVNILGTDAIPFLRKAERDGIHKKNEFYSLYKTFVGRLKTEKKKDPQRDQSKAYVFLLELAEKEKSGDTAKMFDQVLCETLDGYPSSVQRRQVAERFVKEGPDYSRPYFADVKAEVEKTPVAERRDFRAEGELLSPETEK